MMSRIRIRCLLTVLVSLRPGDLGWAGQPGRQSSDRHKWWLSARVQQEVGITSEQAQTLEAIFQSVMPELRAHKAELDRLEQAVSDLPHRGHGDRGPGHRGRRSDRNRPVGPVSGPHPDGLPHVSGPFGRTAG